MLYQLLVLFPAIAQWLLLQSSPMCCNPLYHKHIGHKRVGYVVPTLQGSFQDHLPCFKNSANYWVFRDLRLKNLAGWAVCQCCLDLLLADCVFPLKNTHRTKNTNVFLHSHFSVLGLTILTVAEHTGASSTSVNCHLSLFFCLTLEKVMSSDNMFSKWRAL